jgi:hypothetical protein
VWFEIQPDGTESTPLHIIYNFHLTSLSRHIRQRDNNKRDGGGGSSKKEKSQNHDRYIF